MKKFSVALVAMATILVFAPAARADTVTFYTLGATGAGNASFTLDLNVVGGTVTSASGSVTFYPNTGGSLSETVTGLVSGSTITGGTLNGAVGTSTAGGYDQLLSLLFPYADTKGLALTLSNGDDLQIWINSIYPDYVYAEDETSNGVGKPFTVATYADDSTSLNIAPEPSTLIMFGTGLLGLAGLLRFKFAKKSI